MNPDDQLASMLKDKSTVVRRNAAKRIQQDKSAGLGDALYTACVQELELGRYWQTEIEMIKALGAIRYAPAEDLLLRICHDNKEYDMVTHTAAMTYVRLKRASLADIQPVLVLLTFGQYAVASGAVVPVGVDKMKPDEQGLRELITRCWDLGAGRKKGYLDPRYPVAAACALWPQQLVREFLQHCIDTGDDNLKEVARQALDGKYVKVADD